jgi:hypothetical protein
MTTLNVKNRQRLSIVFKGKKWWLGWLELKDSGALLELIAVMELSVVRVRSIHILRVFLSQQCPSRRMVLTWLRFFWR